VFILTANIAPWEAQFGEINVSSELRAALGLPDEASQ
jgi:hypothetical protein